MPGTCHLDRPSGWTYNVITKNMRANLIRIGNSRGIRIPKPLLEQAGLGGTVELLAEKGQIVIRPDRSPRQGWEEAFRAMAERGDDDVLLGKISSAFDRDEWTW
jgi:antitoxin MazE